MSSHSAALLDSDNESEAYFPMPAAPIGSLRRDSEFGCGAGTSVDALEDSVDSARLCSPTPRRASDGSSLNMISPVRPRTLFLRQRSGSSFSPSTSPRAPDSSCDGGAGLPKRASVGDLPRLKTSMTSPGCMVYVAGAGGGAGAGGAAGAAAGLRLRRSQSMGNVAETLVQHASQESIDVEDELSEYPCDPPMRVPSRVLDPSMNLVQLEITAKLVAEGIIPEQEPAGAVFLHAGEEAGASFT